MSEENVAVVREIFEAFGRRDVEAGEARLHPDLELDTSQVAVPGQQGVYHGRESVRQFWGTVLRELGALEFHVNEIIDRGNDVVVIARVTGRGRTSGAPAELRFAAIYTVQDGLVVRLRAYANRDAALEAAGGGE